MSSKKSKMGPSSSFVSSGKLLKAFLNPFNVSYIIHLRVKNGIAFYTFDKFTYAINDVVQVWDAYFWQWIIFCLVIFDVFVVQFLVYVWGAINSFTTSDDSIGLGAV